MRVPARLAPRLAVVVAALPLLAVGATDGGALVGGSAAADTPVEQQVGAEAAARINGRRVVLVSLDGLHRKAISRLGRKRAPTLHRLIRRGASTLNARTLRERTLTLPNHTGMLTGRRVDVRQGGHGVWFNTDPGTTVSHAAGEHVSSVFEVVHDAGGSTALLTSKDKFAFFRRSWRGAIDRFTYRASNRRLARAAVRELRRDRAFTMLHLSAPDTAGHAHGFLSPRYLRAVERTDRNLGLLVDALRADRERAQRTVVLVTADHGGPRHHRRHSAAGLRANYTVPVIAWGGGVARGDLYELNPAFRDPGAERTGYRRPKQPIRNGMVANLATSLLGLRAVPGSTLDRAQQLDVLS